MTDTRCGKAIVRKIEHIATEAATKGIAGELPAADIERIKALQCTLTALPEKATIPLHWAALIGIACLLVASVALAFRVPWPPAYNSILRQLQLPWVSTMIFRGTVVGTCIPSR